VLPELLPELLLPPELPLPGLLELPVLPLLEPPGWRWLLLPLLPLLLPLPLGLPGLTEPLPLVLLLPLPLPPRSHAATPAAITVVKSTAVQILRLLMIYLRIDVMSLTTQFSRLGRRAIIRSRAVASRNGQIK